jgi:hypothetical protein
MYGRSVVFAVLLQGLLISQDLSLPFAPGDRFSISHTPITAKLVPLDCDAKKIPIHSYKHAGNEATFLIPQDSPTCTYEVMGTQIKVVRPAETKNTAQARRPEEPKAKPR